MLISSDEFLKGSRNEGNICQLFDSLCERRAAADQEETAVLLRLLAAGGPRSRDVDVFVKEQPDGPSPEQRTARRRPAVQHR